MSPQSRFAEVLFSSSSASANYCLGASHFHTSLCMGCSRLFPLLFSNWIQTFAPLESNRKIMKKRFWHASTGRKTQLRRRNQQTAAMQRRLEEVGKKRCPRYFALRQRITTAQSQKIKACDTRHGARVVQRAPCSASANKNFKIPFFPRI